MDNWLPLGNTPWNQSSSSNGLPLTNSIAEFESSESSSPLSIAISGLIFTSAMPPSISLLTIVSLWLDGMLWLLELGGGTFGTWSIWSNLFISLLEPETEFSLFVANSVLPEKSVLDEELKGVPSLFFNPDTPPIPLPEVEVLTLMALLLNVFFSRDIGAQFDTVPATLLIWDVFPVLFGALMGDIVVSEIRKFKVLCFCSNHMLLLFKEFIVSIKFTYPPHFH